MFEIGVEGGWIEVDEPPEIPEGYELEMMGNSGGWSGGAVYRKRGVGRISVDWKRTPFLWSPPTYSAMWSRDLGGPSLGLQFMALVCKP